MSKPNPGADHAAHMAAVRSMDQAAASHDSAGQALQAGHDGLGAKMGAPIDQNTAVLQANINSVASVGALNPVGFEGALNNNPLNDVANGSLQIAGISHNTLAIDNLTMGDVKAGNLGFEAQTNMKMPKISSAQGQGGASHAA